MVSRVFCRECLQEMQKCIYRGHMLFDPQSEEWEMPSGQQYRWIDMVFVNTWSGFSWYHHNPNEKYVWT
eukprot:14185712-Alexandrium_andersonii.AAC.1